MSGQSQNFLVPVCLLTGPLVAFGIYKLRRSLRRIQQAERDALPCDPKPEPKPCILLRRFSAPEQQYLRQLLHTTGYVFVVVIWLTFGVLILPAFEFGLSTRNSWNNPWVFLWFRILLEATALVGLSCFIFGVVTANLIVSPLRFGTTAQFFRTRPLGIGFLFWANLIVVLGTELAAILAGVGAAMLFLAAIHGPIWLHLPQAFPGVVTPNDGKQELYVSLLATSPPRVLLSICTTITLSFSVFAALLAVPYTWSGTQGSRPNVFALLATSLGICAYIVLNLALTLGAVRLPPWLFMYSQLGSPPPYTYALIPVAISACLLFLARYFVGKSEV